MDKAIQVLKILKIKKIIDRQTNKHTNKQTSRNKQANKQKQTDKIIKNKKQASK